MGLAPDPRRQGLRRRPEPGGDARQSRHAHRARPEQPVPRPLDRGEPRPVPPHARRRVSQRRPRAARQDRYGLRQHQPARSRALPHPARHPPAHGQRLVHLSELRLRARPVGRHRGRHALHLHTGVRGPPAALRLAHRQPPRSVAAQAVRVRPPQHDLYGALQARADRAGARRARVGLGRSAHADPRRPAPPRRAPRGHPRFRQAGGGGQGQQRRRPGPVRVLGARGAEPHGAQTHGRAAAAQGGDRELAGRQGGGAGGAQPPRRARRGLAHHPFRPRALHRARRLHGECAEEVLSPLAGPRGAAALCLFRHLPRGGEERGRRGGGAQVHV